MKLLKKHRVLCVVLACVLLLTVIGAVIAWHGEWWYPIWRQMRGYEEIDLHRTELTVRTRIWTLKELSTADGVVFSDQLMLINATHPLPTDYEPTLIEYNGAKMYPEMIEHYITMRDIVMAETGVRIYVSSDFRTAEEQAEILESAEDGIAAGVGESEHETGLALDIYAPHFVGKNILRSRAGRMINDVCHEYGFIIRYPKGKEEITGIQYEPWHLRYVGEPHARIIGESGITLEEYVELLLPNQWYASGDYLISRRSPDNFVLPTAWESCVISPDNTGYYIVTIQLN